MSPKKLLLVEDDPFLSSLLKARLTKEGFLVFHAVDGEEALQMAEKEKPDLVLLDLILPKKSGFEVLEIMRGDPRLEKVPTMIVSNLGQESDLVRGRELGAIAYFIKAKTSIDILVKEVKDFFEEKHQ